MMAPYLRAYVQHNLSLIHILSEGRIYQAIDQGDFTAARFLKDEYLGLRQMLGDVYKRQVCTWPWLALLTVRATPRSACTGRRPPRSSANLEACSASS